MAARKPPDDDAMSLADVKAQQAAQDAAADAATQAAAGGATPAQARDAATTAAEEALANFRLHQEDVDRIAQATAKANVDLLREAGAFDPPGAAPAAGTPAAGTAAADNTVPGPSAAAVPAGPPPVPMEAQPPSEPVQIPRKLTLAEKFAGVTE